MTFDEFMAEHGWRHVVEDHPGGEVEGESYGPYRSHDACKEVKHNDLWYAYCISLPEGLWHAAPGDWERQLPILEFFWEAFLKGEGVVLDAA